MTADIAVITSIYDHYDQLKPVLPQIGAEIDWVFVTDDPLPDTLGWRQIHEEWPEMHPNRAAKQAKLRPWEYTDAPASVWIDASIRVASVFFAADMLSYLISGDIAQFLHPWRNCMYDEAAISAALLKYAEEPVLPQVDHYRRLGMPAGFGLWAGGVIARRHSEDIREMGERWTNEINQWSFQDQISEPYVLWSLGFRPVTLPGDHIRNAWVVWEGSGRH